tara:strand:+ start:84 stop:464 length:381 start_codon:yes stop_codon:yes gene_type:complete
MKTIYKEPRASKPQANEVEAVRKLNSTGSLRRVEGTRYDLIVSYSTPIAYVVDVENDSFINETKVILCNHYYSATTRKHQAKVRELYPLTAIGEFDLGGFKTRAEIDSVDVRGGVNGGTNSNWLHA